MGWWLQTLRLRLRPPVAKYVLCVGTVCVRGRARDAGSSLLLCEPSLRCGRSQTAAFLNPQKPTPATADLLSEVCKSCLQCVPTCAVRCPTAKASAREGSSSRAPGTIVSRSAPKNRMTPHNATAENIQAHLPWLAGAEDIPALGYGACTRDQLQV